jgi:hypothetical protein
MSAPVSFGPVNNLLDPLTPRRLSDAAFLFANQSKEMMRFLARLRLIVWLAREGMVLTAIAPTTKAKLSCTVRA